MLLRQCLQELRLQRGELDALISPCHASDHAVAPCASQTSSTEILVVSSHGLHDSSRFALARLARASDSARVELALAA